MPSFSKQSQQQLKTCHHDLQSIFAAVERAVDCEISCGHRSHDAQEQAYDEGRSGFHWPESHHNDKPSMAVDVMPVDIDEDDMRRWYWFGGYVRGLADRLYDEGVVTHRLHWSGEHGDPELSKYPHFEIYLPH